MAAQRQEGTRFGRVVAGLTALLAAAALGYVVRGWRIPPAAGPETGTGVVEDRLVTSPARFGELPGWEDDTPAAARGALLQSCAVFRRRDPSAPIGAEGLAGRVADWLPFCDALAGAADDAALRQAIATWLRPVRALNNDDPGGLFTGYYEPSLDGSRSRSERYRFPLYGKPDDLVTVDLEAFHERFAGRTISGRIGDGTLLPYYDRGEIDAGALADRGLELVWVDDPVDAFFLHIQGSGRVRLAEGGELRLGYGGQNGRPYFAIGRELVERGELALEEVSLQSIRAWLVEHPDEAAAVMERNPSFIFFRELEGDGPLGTLGVPLTPGRSIAVDRAHLPLGVPLWLAARAPGDVEGAPDRDLRRLMVAQDTGGAIKGPLRGDVFWGHGDDAEWVAGHMNHEGRLWLLLPRSVVDDGAEG